MPLSTARLRRALADLGRASLVASIPLDDLRMLVLGVGVAPEEQPIPPSDAPGWQPVTVGSRWGSPDLTVWFGAAARVPQQWRELLSEGMTSGRYAVALRLLIGKGSEGGFGWPEGLLYVNGRLYQGINRHHQDVLLRPADVVAGDLRFDVRAWSGLLPMDHRIEEAELGLVDRDAEHLYFLLHEGADLVDALGERDPLSYALLDALEHAADSLDPRQRASDEYGQAYRDAVAATLATLQQRLAELRADYAPRERPSIVALGHGHLDVAWLWQTRHTREKAARTFGVATALMERYPEYHFLHTTPQVFAWLKNDYPAIWERVLEREREGRFELAGAMWLESDCILVSGEALVRQIAQGQRFLQEELGHGCEILWLPDAFGYSAALPQIMLRAGLSTFVTTKMSWSETNRIPMDTFRWRGLDGSAVLAHFLTTPTLSSDPEWAKMDTYNGALDIPTVLGAWERYRQKEINHELILAFGYGDGGAGPTRQMLEQARAIQELPGAPELRMGRADQTLRRLRERVWDHPRLPTWDGELYFEYHRGTYTTQAWLKRAHRQAEANLLLAELLDTWLDVWVSPPSGPPLVLGEAWRTLLLHEFHDILPGSSINEVYRDAREAFARLRSTLHTFIEEKLATLASRIEAPKGSLLIFNPSPWPHTALIETPPETAGTTWVAPAPSDESTSVGERVAPLDQQPVSHGEQARALIETPNVPGLGYRLILPMRQDSAPPSEVPPHLAETEVWRRGPARAEGCALENDFFRLELDELGAITSLVDKRASGGRELFRTGEPGNQLLLFDDRPAAFDAWNIDASYEAHSFPLGGARLDVVETGPLRATIRVQRDCGASSVTQDISLYRSIPRIDFATRIDWHEQRRLLKAAFPLDLRTTQATYEAQYGAVERATHRNTSWDQARFEVWAHRWVDLSESDYGVSLLNDGRYGHDVHDATVRISLARGPTYPDPQADQGEHIFTYSLYPHLGDWRAGGTVPAAYALNRPMWTHAVTDSSSPHAAANHGERSAVSLFRAEPEAAVIEAVKRADDGDGQIVRLYESHGGRHVIRVSSLVPLAWVEECDLLERPLTPRGSPSYEAWAASPVASHDAPVWDAAGWSCGLRPFEIRTFRIRVQP